MSNKTLADISKSSISYPTSLSAVGMEEVELLINGQSGLAKIFVQFNDKNSRGIHMSRLYKLLRDTFSSSKFEAEKGDNLCFKKLKIFLKNVLKSHKGQTSKAYLNLAFPLSLKRDSLVSKEWGIRTYPIKIQVSLNTDDTFKCYIKFSLTYSSTCPCSASLAQELNKEALIKKFKNVKNLDINDIAQWVSNVDNVEAFPHAQRSKADFTLLIQPQDLLKDTLNLIESEINKAENTLQTTVQAFVKREDEQAFAKLNAKFPLFCEDAARKLKLLYTNTKHVQDFFIKVSHEESLHPHNAVSFAFKEEGEFNKSKEFLILN